MHTSYENILLQRFQDMGHYDTLESYKDTISNKYKKWMVSSYQGHPILHAHLIWNHITAAFLRYGTLIHFEDYKDPIYNKYTKWMVSSYIRRPILYALLIWNHITAAFSRNETLFNFEGYKDTISNKYTKWMVSSYIGHPILHAHLIWNHITAAFSRNGTLFNIEDYKDTPILQRVGRSPEQHRQRFRSLELGENGRPFVMAHQLRDACRRWLLAGEGGVDQVIDRVVLEQFIARLPTKTAQWVQCHRPASLDLAIQLAEDQLVACHGVGETLPSVSLSLPSPSFSPPTFLPRSRAGVVPRAQPRWRGGPAPESTAVRAHAREAGSAAAIPVPPVSPRQFLVPLPATRVAGKPGPACWRCGDPGHFIDRCPVMEVGTLVRVPDAPQAAPDQAGGYQIPVSIKGGTYWALVDSGCNQTSIHQSLVQPEALDMSCMVRVRCVHGDVAEYPVVRLAIQFRGQKHNVEVAVNPHLRHPLILGTNWPSFKVLLGVLCADASWGKEKPGREAAVRSGEAEPGLAEAAPGDRNAIERLILTERDDFPLEQSQDESLRNAFEQVRSIDGRPLQPARPPSYPYFAILKDRLYRVTQDAQSKQDTTQLLVPKSRREMLFQAAHCNPMAGHLGQATTLNRLMARFFWPGIHENVRRWCAACRECQLVNPPASPKAPLRPLPLMQVPFERIGMDLIGPLERSARGHRFALVLVDYATRYPEAVALRNISAKSVAEALFSMISRVGIPKEILTDQGTAFMSRTIRELYGLLGIKSVRTSVYHPQTDGLVERFNRTLKTMIRKFVHEDAKNWDKWLEPPFVRCARGPASLHGVFPLRAPVRPPAPRGFGRPEGDLGGGTFGE